MAHNHGKKLQKSASLVNYQEMRDLFVRRIYAGLIIHGHYLLFALSI